MAPVQTTYGSTHAAAFLGQIADMQLSNVISGTVEDSAGIGFGLLALQGAADNGIKAATALGLTVGTPVAGAGNTGTGSIGTPTVDAGAQAGDYKVVIIEPGSNVGTYEVFKPDGTLDGTGVVAVAYNGSINFTLADATDFVAGDYITVPVTESVAHKVKGITVRDTTLAPANPDTYPQKSEAAVISRGPIWVTAGATVAPEDDVWFVPSTGRFTNVAGTTNVPVPTAKFKGTATNGNLVIVNINLN